VNRLSTQAQLELQQLNVILQQSQLSEQPDTRLLDFSSTKDKLDTLAIYRLLKAQGQENINLHLEERCATMGIDVLLAPPQR